MLYGLGVGHGSLQVASAFRLTQNETCGQEGSERFYMAWPQRDSRGCSVQGMERQTIQSLKKKCLSCAGSRIT